jgi:hypothetical protein
MVGYRLDGKSDRRKVKAKTEKSCLQKLDEIRAKVAGGMLPERDKANITVERFLRLWLDATRQTVKPSTFKRYEDLVNPHLIPGLGRHRLASLRPDHLVHFYIRQNEERLRLGETWADGDLVSPSTIGTPIDQRNVIRLFKAALRRAGLSESIRFHDLRHASASVALAAGVDLKVISQRLGHSTITITADLYTHVVRKLDSDAADRMQQALRGAV